MSSKKASFESKDPSYVADAPLDGGRPADETFTRKAAFPSIDLAEDFHLPAQEPNEEKEENTEKKASFYARDPDVGTSTVSEPSRKKYMEEERRNHNRRKADDRRSDVRFDVNKTDRRQANGRRKDDALVKYW